MWKNLEIHNDEDEVVAGDNAPWNELTNKIKVKETHGRVFPGNYRNISRATRRSRLEVKRQRFGELSLGPFQRARVGQHNRVLWVARNCLCRQRIPAGIQQ